MSFRKGQTLFYEGHTPYGIYFLQGGKVAFKRGKRVCTGGHLIDIRRGKLIELHSFFEDKPYCCTCRAVEDCHVIFVSKTQLLPLKEKAMR